MKQAFVTVAIVLLALAPLAADIVVTSPNGGEPPMAQGTKWMISWTAANVSQPVRILLIKGAGGKFGTIKEPLEPGASPWEWTVGETDAGMAPAGQYKIRITTLDGSKGDISDTNFTITAGTTPPQPPAGPASLTVTSPNGGEEWAKLGGGRNITWTAVNFTGEVDVVLKQNDKTIGTIAAKLPAKQGSHSWAVGSLLGGISAGIGSGYKVQVVKNYEGLYRPAGSSELADESDNAFSIENALSAPIPEAMKIDVSAPAAESEFEYGSEFLEGNRYAKVKCRWSGGQEGPFKFFLREEGNKTEKEMKAVSGPVSLGGDNYEAEFWLSRKANFTSPGLWYKIHVKSAFARGYSGRFKIKYKVHTVTLEPNILNKFHWKFKTYGTEDGLKYPGYGEKKFPEKAGNARVGFHNHYYTYGFGRYIYEGIVFRSRIRFDFSCFAKLKGKIVDAKLVVKQNWFYHADSMDLNDCDVRFYVLERDWPGADFFSTYGEHLIQNFPAGAANDFYLTDWSEAWRNGSSANHGLLLVGANEKLNHDDLYGVSYYQFWLKVVFQEE